jgi:hypothetical protein
MLTFRPESPPQNIDKPLAGWLTRQFQNVLKAAQAANDSVSLNTLNAEPAHLSEGLTVIADGANWDPGTGQGVYTYYAGAWHKLG